MGQKYSCFRELSLSRFRGRKKSEESMESEAINNAIDLTNEKIPVIKEYTATNEAMHYENCLNFNDENKPSDVPPKAEMSENLQRRSVMPEYQIKDEILILARSKSEEDYIWSASLSPTLGHVDTPYPAQEPSENTSHHELPYIPQKPPSDFLCKNTDDRSFQKSNTRNITNQNSSTAPPIPPRRHEIIMNPFQESSGNTYHHEFPYIPQKPPSDFLCKNTDDRSFQKSNTRNIISKNSSTAPPIPPRRFDIIMNPTNAIWSKTNFFDPRNPPEIPPRRFERY